MGRKIKKIIKWNCSDKRKCLFACKIDGKVIYRSSEFEGFCKECWFKKTFKGVK
jgi:hypothetical protein